MPRYFFHLRRDGVLDKDPDGVECASLAMARQEAMKTAREMISREALAEREPSECSFEIEDEAGRVIARVRFTHEISDTVSALRG
jgi:uncharacterized protein YfcZ (UPF0381/DUF406 family)